MDGEMILGIDSGGSKTTALLAEAGGRVLGRGAAGGSNFQTNSRENVCAAIEGAVDAAFACAGLPRQKVGALCLGLSGADRPKDLGQAEELVKKMGLAHSMRIMNDGWLLLWCGAMQGIGVGLVAGTGSIAFGRDLQGRTARAGGWGWRMGDEGSGYAVALAALNAVTRAADGRGAATSLSEVVLGQLKMSEVSQLIPYVYKEQPTAAEIARLAPLVLAEARRGDQVARHILQAAAQELAVMVLAVAHKLGLESPLPCALGGGWLVGADELVVMLVDDMERAGLDLLPLERVEEPAQGALRLAEMKLDKNW
jgi:N-acetylmuramic acid 6-phosphate etherase